MSFTKEETLLGAVQNYADKDADRKTNLLFIKCFQSSKSQGLTSLFWDGEEDGKLFTGWWTLD